MQGIPNRRALGFIMMTLTLISCGGSDIAPELPRTIAPNSPTPQPPTNPPPGGGTPGDPIPSCESYATTAQLDLDQDGALDILELNGNPDPTNNQIKYRSDPLLDDTDGDGRKDGEEIANKKVTGIAVNDLLRTSVATNPAQRDWIVLVHARGGADGQPVQGNTGNGWNSFGNVGGCSEASDVCQRKKIKKLPGEDQFIVRYVESLNIVRKDLLTAAFSASLYPNLISTFASGDNINCWSGGNNQGGCLGPKGEATNTGGISCLANGDQPAPPLGGYSSNYYVNACTTRRNSLIARFNSTGSRDMTAVNFGPSNNTTCPWCLPFRVGGTPEQSPITNVPVGANGMKWTYNMNSSHDTYNQPLLRSQDQNGSTPINDNGGFLTVILAFNNPDLTQTYKMPVSAADNAALIAQKHAYFTYLLSQPAHAGKCTNL
jgi:hypothetical protein